MVHTEQTKSLKGQQKTDSNIKFIVLRLTVWINCNKFYETADQIMAPFWYLEKKLTVKFYLFFL